MFIGAASLNTLDLLMNSCLVELDLIQDLSLEIFEVFPQGKKICSHIFCSVMIYTRPFFFLRVSCSSSFASQFSYLCDLKADNTTQISLYMIFVCLSFVKL